MRILIAFILLVSWCVGATTYTEFYCDTSNGSTNINAGSTTNSAAVYSSVNGNWDGTSVYTPTDGSTPANTVSAGMWGAIFIDGSTNLIQTSAGGCVMLITNVAAGANGAITFERSAFMGTAPSSSATGRSINVGGCWNGPYRTIGFPFGFAATTGTNGPNVFPRVNFRNTSIYSVTAAMTHANAGPTVFQGYTTTPDDGGRAIIDGGGSGTSYILLTLSGINTDLRDLYFSRNGSSGNARGVVASGTEHYISRCIIADMVSSGLRVSGSSTVEECEAYGNNTSNTANEGGMATGSAGTTFIRCISHDNVGNANNGFQLSHAAIMFHCIAYGNGKNGVADGPSLGASIIGCDFWNNGAAGMDVTGTTASQLLYENCNSLRNGTYGIVFSGTTIHNGAIINCGFGSGTQTNASGNLPSNTGMVRVVNPITYAADVTPWTDPTNGNFTISLTAAKAMGIGLYLQKTVVAPTNTVSYPDIGAAQTASTNAAAASGGAYTWSQ